MKKRTLVVAAILILVPTVVLFSVTMFVQPLLPAPWNNVLIILGVVVAAVLAGLSALADTFHLATKLGGDEKQESVPPNQPPAVSNSNVAERVDAVSETGVAVAQAQTVIAGDVFIADQAAAEFLATLPQHTEDYQAAADSYLLYLLEKYRYMDFRGMGISERVPLRLPLNQMYVPLKARIEMPEGETWSRELKLAGRQVSPAEAETMGQRLSAPTPLLELLQEHDGLIILGDPGAGKTTFLKYLTLRLAQGEGAALGLAARLPILLPLSAYANAMQEHDVPLNEFLVGYNKGLGNHLAVGELLNAALHEGRALLLLDGLDEVKGMAQRNLVVDRVLEFFLLHKARGNKFILTSRVVGYREVRPVAQGLAECTLVDFSPDDVQQFIKQWTVALEQAMGGETEVAAAEAELERAELLAAVQQNPGVSRLAANPLLLTILALMKRQGVVLPERRVELYAKYVETLLKTWNLARGLDRRYSRDLDVVETVRVLAPLALWMHTTSPGIGLVKREEMRRKLEAIYAQRGFADPPAAARQLLDDAHEHANLLLERGRGEFGFIHLTFQEYLAAVAIAQRGQSDLRPLVDLLAEHVGDDNWHEVTLLTIGYVGIVQQRDEAAGEVLQRLIAAAPGTPGSATVLAGEAVLDVWPGGVSLNCKKGVVAALEEMLPVGLSLSKADLRQAQVSLAVAALTRARAGQVLGKLGDLRAPIMAVDALPFCYVPPGPFLMGSDAADVKDREKPQHTVDLPYAYWIGQYPLSHAQFGAFVADGGYGQALFWDEAKQAGYWQNGAFRERTAPYEIGFPFDLPNHPVVGISWYEALAFTRWLTQRWQAAGWLPQTWRVLLPSEAEWEKAARGGQEAAREPLLAAIQDGVIGSPVVVGRTANPLPARRFPWGDELTPERANYEETAIGSSSTPGCFPAGVSPYGCHDLSGNVDEWTRSLYKKYPYRYDDGREEINASDDSRVLRGGSFGDGFKWLRCASRFRYDPVNVSRDFGLRLVVSPFFHR